MSAPSLSAELEHVSRHFEPPHSGDGSITLDNPLRERVLETLRTMRDLAYSMELELIGHRRIEADRAGRRFLETAAGDALRGAPVEQDGNVYRPDFGGRT